MRSFVWKVLQMLMDRVIGPIVEDDPNDVYERFPIVKRNHDDHFVHFRATMTRPSTDSTVTIFYRLPMRECGCQQMRCELALDLDKEVFGAWDVDVKYRTQHEFQAELDESKAVETDFILEKLGVVER